MPMKIIRKIEELSYEDHKTGVALGTFDGLHVGHQKVIRNLVDVCRQNN